MTTTSLQSLNTQSFLRQNHHHYLDTHSSSSLHSSLFLKPSTTTTTTTISLSYKLSPGISIIATMATMKKLDTEMEQYNYRAFPTEFIWELNDDTPAGHLPLTNALRGTQLLKYIFKHPAFETADGEVSDGEEQSVSDIMSAKPLSKKLFSTDYSF
ncbi:hypothetical protein MKW94_023817 [Papaver nudicaule]|uniref:GUN4-like domain-containing protein n=1 Tax=Papaver nudicaule TaxID=74823 RepID=A0AA41W1P2_PAPNU|nr:hypothetical protein [Papaver nudicaule]